MFIYRFRGKTDNWNINLPFLLWSCSSTGVDTQRDEIGKMWLQYEGKIGASIMLLIISEKPMGTLSSDTYSWFKRKIRGQEITISETNM